MSPWRSAVMPSGLKDPGGNDAKRSTRPRSHAAASSGIRAKQASRNKAAREIADISPPRKIVGAASLSLQRRSVKKTVLVVVLFVVVLFPVVALRQADEAALTRRVDGAVLAAGPQVDED